MGKRSTLQAAALIFGAIYLAAGVLGFVPSLGGSDTQTDRALFGIFQVNLLHNVVHVVIGVAGLAATSSLANARTLCKLVGVILLLLGAIGNGAPNPYGLLALVLPDIRLHLSIAAVLA